MNIAPVDRPWSIDGAEGTVESAISMDILDMRVMLQSLN